MSSICTSASFTTTQINILDEQVFDLSISLENTNSEIEKIKQDYKEFKRHTRELISSNGANTESLKADLNRYRDESNRNIQELASKIDQLRNIILDKEQEIEALKQELRAPAEEPEDAKERNLIHYLKEI